MKKLHPVTHAVVLAVLAVGAQADPILQVHGPSLTVYQATPTRVQNVLPLATQRGVGIDGLQRARGAFSWALAGNPFETSAADDNLNGLRFATGAYALYEVDLALPAQVPWVIGRTYNQVQETASPSHHDSNGYQGVNWFQASQPELVFCDADSNGATKEAEDLVYLVYGADRYVEFKRTDDDEDTFRGVNGTAGVIEHEPGTPDLWVYYDQNGTRTYFFGANAVVEVEEDEFEASWQIWKIVDPAGNAAYVGHPTTASTAIANGYNLDGTIAKAYDSAGRRYCYTYAMIDGALRLEQVIAETEDGEEGWGGCGEETLVGKVEYAYYRTGDDAFGSHGDLQLVTVTTPLSDPNEVMEQRRHYRYWKGVYHSTDNPGYPGTLKMILGFEGVRRADWDTDSVIDGGTLTDLDDDLKPYTDAFFKYDTDRRIKSVFFNGECGCGSGGDGEYRLNYEDNPGFSGTSGYDTTWHRRVVVEPPTGGAWITQYLDETGQPLSQVLTDADPANTSPHPKKWVTQIARNSDGQVTEVHTPANVSGYTHNSGSPLEPDGAITTSSSDGLVWYRERVPSGDTKGFLQGSRQKAGSNNLSSDSEYTEWTQYATRDLTVASGVHVSRPVVVARRAFHTATDDYTSSANYDETTWSRSWWSSTDTSAEYLAPKQVTETAPPVSTGKNGSGSATTTKQYFRRDRTLAFSESARGIVEYRAYTQGQITKVIEDAKTDAGTAYPSDEHPNTDYGITSDATGFHRTAEYSYDMQGRSDETVHPSSRISKRWYTKLPDARFVTFDIPRLGSYHGPATYTTSNQAGETEDCATVAIDPSGTSEPLDGWIEIATPFGPPPSDPISSFNQSGVGPIARLTSSRYGPTGRKLESRHVYHDIPSSIDGAIEGNHFDAWAADYDSLGRQIRVREPSGTIVRTTYDPLGRIISRYIGTNDSSFPNGELAGTDNMVLMEKFEYDGGCAGGNSDMTCRELFVQDDNVVVRKMEYIYDYRGRLKATIAPEVPHVVMAYDNQDRLIAHALYESEMGLNASTNPATASTNRVGLKTLFYDERGNVYKTQRHKIDQQTGADADLLQASRWYDPDGRLIKTDAEQLTKVRYDRLGRATQSFILATDDDSSYSDVYDSSSKFAAVAGDKVLEERQIGYDGELHEALVQAIISREHDDTSTTGPLDTTYDGGDGLPLKFTASDVKGRIQVTAMWYDELDRPVTTAYYGTGDATDNTGTLDRDGLSEPSASDSAKLVTKTVYSDAGTVAETVDALGRVSRFVHDDAGRLVATIVNYTGGSLANAVRDHDIHTRYAYVAGLQTKIWVDIDGDGVEDAEDQVTQYVYGTPKGTPGSGSPVQSAIASGHLLREVIYPPQTGGQSAADRTVTYAYNVQGEQVWTRDQAGNVVQTDYDTAGRETHRRALNVATGFDGAVKRISTTYLTRGMVDRVTQYDNASPGSGAIIDDVRITYDDWGNIEALKQDVDSDLDGSPSGRAMFEVAHTYAKATAGRNTLRRSGTSLPGDTAIEYVYSPTSGKLDQAMSRVTTVRVAVGPGWPDPVPVVPVAQYEYVGTEMLAGTDLPEPDARWSFFEGATGTNPYPDLDRFNRVTSSRWTSYKNSGSRSFYDVDIAYDAASNITGVVDNVHKNVSGSRNFDVLYMLDDLSRLVRAEEGTLSSGAISNRSRDERWLDSSGGLALSQTGNWLRRRLDLNGDGLFSGTGELDDSGTFNLANELRARDVDTDTIDNYTLGYDKAGNQTDDGETYTYVYDPFGRLRQVKSRSTTDLIAEYRYNGLGFRIGWHSDVTDDGTNDLPDGSVDSHDPWFYFCYDDAWRQVATFRGTDAAPKEVFVHHNAGLSGFGGSSYIDAVILRDRDADTDWWAAADSTREERRYLCQNWRADVSVMLTDTGILAEWIKYSSYGVPIALPSGDTDSDGDFDATDLAAITGGYEVRKDANLDGTVDFFDALDALDMNNGYATLGRGVLSSPRHANRRGYGGYEYDPTFQGANRHLYHVRHRVYDTSVGRWTQRDPIGYVDGLNLYQYVTCRPIIYVDPLGQAGLAGCAVGGGIGGVVGGGLTGVGCLVGGGDSCGRKAACSAAGGAAGGCITGFAPSPMSACIGGAIGSLTTARCNSLAGDQDQSVACALLQAGASCAAGGGGALLRETVEELEALAALVGASTSLFSNCDSFVQNFGTGPGTGSGSGGGGGGGGGAKQSKGGGSARGPVFLPQQGGGGLPGVCPTGPVCAGSECSPSPSATTPVSPVDPGTCVGTDCNQ